MHERTDGHGVPANAADEEGGARERAGHSDLLEKRYRRVLRLLPVSYRAEREEEMVDAFMEGSGGLTDADDPRPRWPEVASVAALAVRVRLGGVGATPRHVVWGEAVRLAAVMGLAFQAMISCTWPVYLLIARGFPGAMSAEYHSFFENLSISQLLDFTGLLWIGAFVVLVRGRVRAAKVLACLALVLHLGPHALREGLFGPGGGFLLTYSLMYVVPVLALLAGFHRDAPPPRAARWVIVLFFGGGLSLHLALTLMTMTSVADPEALAWAWSWTSATGMACLAFLLAGATVLGGRPWMPDGWRSPALPLALAMLAVPVAAVLANELTFDLNHDPADQASRLMTSTTAAQLAAVVLCGLVLTVAAVRSMPAPAPATPIADPPAGAH
ncbi:hypothetical protein ACFYSC_08130 [Streptosporangium sp. NPDC004379]|uniref:hypothetical protein n=1 Tax=Streptosporangium sp. NPDC004379 TaxID=3366189 RepID=UPI0036C58121